MGIAQALAVESASLSEVLTAFKAATPVEAPNFAGGLFAVSLAVGGVLVLAWLFQAGRNAGPGAFLQAPRVLLLVAAAFMTLLFTLGVFYR
jgi:hypothetical protein